MTNPAIKNASEKKNPIYFEILGTHIYTARKFFNGVYPWKPKFTPLPSRGKIPTPPLDLSSLHTCGEQP